jgi:integrase
LSQTIVPFRRLTKPVQPHIFSEIEIARLLQAAAKMPTSPRYVLRPLVLRLAVVLLYTTGLRRGELVRLTLADYDRHEHALLVRNSKFHKSRFLPLSADASMEIEAYLSARKKHHLPILTDSPLFWSGRDSERAFSASALRDGMREAVSFG